MSNKPQRGRNFAFTFNNYPSTVLVDEIPCKYIVYGKEVGESGTPHLQGTIVFPQQRTVSAVIKDLPGCHVELCIDVFASIEYCKKEGQFTERGDPPKTKQAAAREGGEATQEKYRQIRHCLQKKDRDLMIFQMTSDSNPRLPHAVEYTFDLSDLNAAVLSDTVAQHLWYYGDAGTGKSRKAREENPERISKDVQ